MPRRIKNFPVYANALQGGSGLEIGGPSETFSQTGRLPVYSLLNSLDGCNFSSSTAWEGEIKLGHAQYVWSGRHQAGYQYLLEASDLQGIDDGKYSTVLSCHCIEHLANPLAALKEWRRVLMNNGHLVLVTPHRNGTFDHARPVTSFSHLLEDFRDDRGEDDKTHIEEALALHDFSRDPSVGNLENFRHLCSANSENRCLHHHVFDTELVVKMLDHAGFRLIDVSPSLPCHIITLAQKKEAFDNSAFLVPEAIWREVSPFPGDVNDDRRRSIAQ